MLIVFGTLKKGKKCVLILFNITSKVLSLFSITAKVLILLGMSVDLIWHHKKGKKMLLILFSITSKVLILFSITAKVLILFGRQCWSYLAWQGVDLIWHVLILLCPPYETPPLAAAVIRKCFSCPKGICWPKLAWNQIVGLPLLLFWDYISGISANADPH